MTELDMPIAATFTGVYIMSASASGTNQIAITLNAVPLGSMAAATPVTSSITTLSNAGTTFPQTFTTQITPSELGTSTVWVQVDVNLAAKAVGPYIYRATLVLYY